MVSSASLSTHPPSAASSATNPTPFRTPALLLSRVLFAIAFLAQIIVEFRFWHLTWDDSAITLGFARTFAHTGRIEPTPGSGIVEGYSTTLWMLLMALAAKLVSTPAALLAVAKLSTLALNLLNLVLIRRWFTPWTSEVLANLVAATFGCSFLLYETINGMETPLIVALVFTMLLLHRSRHRLAPAAYLTAGALLSLTRWEAVWFLVPFLLVARPLRRALRPALVWAGVFVVSNLVRLWYFGAILPNTITAKRGVPYTESTAAGELRRHLLDPKFIILSCSGILVILTAVLLYDRFRNRPRSLTARFRSTLDPASWELRFSLAFVAAVLILVLAVGSNTGPDVRAFFPAWPFVFGLLFLPLLDQADPTTARVTFPFAVVTLCLLSANHLRTRLRDLRSPPAPIYEPNATVDKIAAVGTAIADVQQASGHRDVLFAGPDMGGIMLYANGVRLIDLGLLCNTTLARHRYGITHQYVLVENHPDIIEVHQRWLEMTALNHDPLFLGRYRPVYVDNTRLFLERSLLADIPPARLTEHHFTLTGHLADPAQDRADHTIYAPVDRALNEAFGTYFVLN